MLPLVVLLLLMTLPIFVTGLPMYSSFVDILHVCLVVLLHSVFVVLLEILHSFFVVVLLVLLVLHFSFVVLLHSFFVVLQ